MTRHRSVFVACGLSLIWATTAAQQVRDNAPVVVAGTATISGRVMVDGASKQPARKVRVTLAEVSRSIPGQTTTTDDNGAFAFQGLPAGRFEVQATKPGFLRGSFGASRPDRPGTPIVVKDGEAVTNLAVTIARGGVITGAVRNVRGKPVPGVSVRVLRFGFSPLTGERTLGAQSGGSRPVTDDRGVYRAYGLPPGSYLVLAIPGSGGRADGPGDDIRVLTSVELQQATRAGRGAANAEPPKAPPVRVSYAPVFHPGVSYINAASTITLGLSEEHDGADITIQYVPTATVTGKVTSPSGTLPRPLGVTLVPTDAPAELLAGAGLRGASASLSADGTFVFTGVAPGTYKVKANSGQAGGGRGIATPSPEPLMWAAANVAISGESIDVPLTLQSGVTINGRVVFEGAQPTPQEIQSITFRLLPSGAGSQLLSTTGGRVDAEGRFTFSDLTPDTYGFLGGAPPSGKWSLKSSVANGSDAYDAPLNVGASSLDWTLTYTDKPTTLTGLLVDGSGRAATAYYVLAFPTDRRYWAPGSRRVRMMRPATDGNFTTTGLLPGEYFLAALTDLEPGEWNDPAFLEQLLSSGVKVILRDGETTRQDLRIGT